MPANGKGISWFVLAIICPLLVAAIIGGIVMYGDIQTAKANNAMAKETNDKQDVIISEIPALTSVAASIARSVDRLATDKRTFIEKVDTYIQEDIARDSRDHHTHRGGNP